MSTIENEAGQISDEFRSTFHISHSYLDCEWQNRVVLEASDETRFHFPLDTLAEHTGVFSDLSTTSAPADNHQKPVVITLASANGLCYFLDVLTHQSGIDQIEEDGEEDEEVKAVEGDIEDLGDLPVAVDSIIMAVRIAHFLDAPIVGDGILKRTDLDVYLRFAIHRAFDMRFWIWYAREGIDVSFNLKPDAEYKRAVELLKEVDPDAEQRLAIFHQKRKNAMIKARRWLRMGDLGIPYHFESQHSAACRLQHAPALAIRSRLDEIVPSVMAEVANSKSYRERCDRVKTLVVVEAGCERCLDELWVPYRQTLEEFTVNFPNYPEYSVYRYWKRSV